MRTRWLDARGGPEAWWFVAWAALVLLPPATLGLFGLLPTVAGLAALRRGPRHATAVAAVAVVAALVLLMVSVSL